MSYSGTTTFMMTRDDMIAAALRGLEVYGAGESPTATDITNCTQAMNILLKAWGGQGMNLWTNVDKELPLVAGQAAYSIGPSGADLVCNLPLRITDAYLRTAGVDTKVQIMSRYDYDTVANKTAQGLVSQVFYDPQIPNGKLYLAAAPNSSATVLHFVSQEAIQDVGSASDNPYIPQEWYQLLKWSLMDEVSIEYGCKASTVQLVAGKAKALRDQLNLYVENVFGTLAAPAATSPSTRTERA